MFFGFVIIRVLFTVCMVFIIGYVFGNFSKNAALRVITRVASILVIITFVATNIFIFRAGAWHRGYRRYAPGRNDCKSYQTDSLRKGDDC